MPDDAASPAASRPFSSPPSPSPRLSCWPLCLPACMAVLGMLLAWAAATSGQDERRTRDTLQLNYDRYYWRSELAEAKLAGKPPEEIAHDQKILDQKNAAKLISYARYGRQFTSWDGYRYEEIVDQGYIFHQPDWTQEQKDDSLVDVHGPEKRAKNVVWYPLYPVLAIAVRNVLGIDTTRALTVVSWICCFFGAVVLFCYARRHYILRADRLALPATGSARLTAPDSAALWAVALLLFGPCSIFLYANFTESLFVLLLAGFLYCLQQRWWWRAALVAGVASACRSQGVLFGPILAATYLVRNWPMNIPQWGKRLGLAYLMGVVSGLGLLSYMIFLQLRFHDPLAFMHAQRYWNVGISLDRILYAADPRHAYDHIKYYLESGSVDWPRLWEGVCLIWPPIVLLIWGRRMLSFELWLVGWMLWGLPYVSNSMAGNPPFDTQWMSMGRFMAVALPVYLIGGALFQKRPWLGILFLVPWALTFGIFAYKYGSGAWVG